MHIVCGKFGHFAHGCRQEWRNVHLEQEEHAEYQDRVWAQGNQEAKARDRRSLGRSDTYSTCAPSNMRVTAKGGDCRRWRDPLGLPLHG